ncbi:MAG: hypothetical protein IT204_01610 [Fimbriimonadaceae bacterium]|nr:hypothetical protein [Fimbriimonadaceae bacterium]
MLCSVVLLLLALPEPPVTQLGLTAGHFTVNGRPTFLLGFSYYAGLGAPADFVQQDLDDFRAAGFNWLRVFATLAAYEDTSAVDVGGQPREPYLGRLKALLDAADRRGMVVDVTLARGRCLPDLAVHRQAVQTLARELLPWRNLYFDLANERDLRGDGFVPLAEVAELARLVRVIDPGRLLTASDCDPTREALAAFLAVPQLSFSAPHRWRDPSSVRSSRPWTAQTIATMRELGRVVPLHYQEPQRRGFAARWEPQAADFLADLQGAVEGGAAGWCFHNGPQNTAGADQRPRRSFDLRPAEGRLWQQLDEVEREVVKRCAGLVRQAAEP